MVILISISLVFSILSRFGIDRLDKKINYTGQMIKGVQDGSKASLENISKIDDSASITGKTLKELLLIPERKISSSL
ncbi:MAG: hypothetical protein QXX95_07070 [Nitrososphaerales archaeon]